MTCSVHGLRRSGLRLPRIEDFHAGAVEVLHIAGHHYQIMRERSSGQQGVDNGKRSSFADAMNQERCPTVRDRTVSDRTVNRQNAPRKPIFKIGS